MFQLSQSQSSQTYFSPFEDMDSSIHAGTHLGVGAHPDDLEVMAGHGILQCYDNQQDHFIGVIATTGSGSAKPKELANISSEKLAEIRKQEQLNAAGLGKYAGLVMLGYESSDIKSKINDTFVSELQSVIEATKPKVIYTHNIFDKHQTHVGVTLNLVQALKKSNHKPKHFYGCEVWRGLDWLPDSQKITLPISNPKLVHDLIACHKSQVSDAKDYGVATVGRMKSNATFFDASNLDQQGHQIFAMDLLPLLEGSLKAFVAQPLNAFKSEVDQALNCFTGESSWK